MPGAETGRAPENSPIALSPQSLATASHSPQIFSILGLEYRLKPIKKHTTQLIPKSSSQLTNRDSSLSPHKPHRAEQLTRHLRFSVRIEL
ncbi:unnamed protein product [Cuscuta epithymum]|uniref:Uncharacterized protein n=1 Tax=Cuscuta epithymum TaxID=186058 RepID=A0AAV0GL28_9ASTE|nr:unnamed protein product [Cuscuta epithymum]